MASLCTHHGLRCGSATQRACGGAARMALAKVRLWPQYTWQGTCPSHTLNRHPSPALLKVARAHRTSCDKFLWHFRRPTNLVSSRTASRSCV